MICSKYTDRVIKCQNVQNSRDMYITSYLFKVNLGLRDITLENSTLNLHFELKNGCAM